MTATLSPIQADSSLRCIRDAMRTIQVEYDFNAEANLFGKPLPGWVAELSASLHAAHDNLVNAIDPSSDRDFGWWEKL